MKKLAIMILVVMLILAGCGPAKENATPTDAYRAEGMGEDAKPAAKRELANSCIDQPVEALYALIGQPNASEYSPSCLGDGEDGNLYYDGFTVFTYRDSSGETVLFVE